MNDCFNQIRTLVIDNNSSMRQIIVSMIRAMGIKTILVANNEKQCFDLIATEGINLVISGWSMPKLNALSILTQLRNSEKTQEIPFIIVSSIIDQESIKQAVLNGVSAYLVPPFNKMIFENRINKALKIPITLSATNITEKINAKRLGKKKNKAKLDVLIVDDVAENIDIIKEPIKDDYNIKAVLDAKSALKICQSDSPPDLILLDILMPEVNGLMLCKQLKANPLTQNIVIIFLTALSETKDVVKGLSLGAVDYITKPIVPAILLARLNVHSQLVMNQRAIQSRVDSLIDQSSQQNKYDKLIQNGLHHFIDSARESTQELCNSHSSTRKLPTPLLQLQYNLGMSDFLVEKKAVLDQIEQKHSILNSSKKELVASTLPLIDIFTYMINEKNLERFEYISADSCINCNDNLFKVLFMCLYQNAIEAAPRGSKVTVESKQLDNYTLITIHNIGQIPEELALTFDQPFVSSKNNKGTGLGVYLAFVLSEQMQGNLYYHSSEKFGTSFYIKLPR